MNQKPPNIFFHFGDKTLDLFSLKTRNKIQIRNIFIPTPKIILAEQTHSNFVHIVNKKDAGTGLLTEPIPNVDALMTNEKNIFLAIKTADCVPILIFDPVEEVVAAVHSGREGTRKKIISIVLNTFKDNFKSNPKNIYVKIGPSICKKCYKVDKDTFGNFVSSTGIKQYYPFLDLKKVLIKQILEEGIPEKNIENYNICTFENENYYSYRRNKTKKRQISLIGIIQVNR